MRQNRSRFGWIGLTSCLLAVGCHSSPDSVRVVSLKRGIDYSAVSKTIGKPDGQVFDLIISGARWQCDVYSGQNPPEQFYLVFRDGKLKTVCTPPEFERCWVTSGSNPISRPDYLLLRAEYILALPDRTTVDKPTTQPVSADYGEFAGWMLAMAPFAVVFSPVIITAFAIDAAETKVNAWEFVPGESVAQVESVLKQPKQIWTIDDHKEFRRYQASRIFETGECPIITIMFEDHRAAAVFGGELLDDTWNPGDGIGFLRYRTQPLAK